MAVEIVNWDDLIHRAEVLSHEDPPSAELLRFSIQLFKTQKHIYESFRSNAEWLPTGDLNRDSDVLENYVPILLETVQRHGPPALAEEAQSLLNANEVIPDLLLTYWNNPTDVQFFAKAFLQPYARWLAESGGQPVGRTFQPMEHICPFCGGRPQVSYLQIAEASAESGNRNLICATCLTSWVFRRVVCAYCLEERPFKLGYFQTDDYDHVRIETCDTCKKYIKGVDLTRLGLAVPLVDEVATAALDIWAKNQGYQKIELNLVGI